MSARARRLAVVWVPDWPVVASLVAGVAPPAVPIAICDGRRVRSASAAARRAGVRSGMKRRSAQELCPEAVLVPWDGARDARVFDEIAGVLEDLAPGVELLRPGLALSPAAGASRYYGSDQAFAEHLLTQLAARTGTEASVGIADGVLAGILAARRGDIVPVGTSREYLAPYPLRNLAIALNGTAHGEDLNVLIDLLQRLGIRTLGDFAELPRGNVTERFGSLGEWAQRLVRAREVMTVPARRTPHEFVAELRPDVPLADVETAARVARRLADELHEQLLGHGQTYERLRVEAHTETGERLERTWRLEGVDSAGIADRVRWQLEGWLSGRSGLLPTGGLVLLNLKAEEVHGAAGAAQRLWGDAGHGQVRAMRGAERVQTMLGGDGVYVPVVQGGRDPRSRLRLVSWGDDPVPLRPLDRPWPGSLPDPAPATVPAQVKRADVLDARGKHLEVSAALELSGTPRYLMRDHSKAKRVRSTIAHWAGPWPMVERWWAPDARRRVFLQAAVNSGQREETVLLALENGDWTVEGAYD